MPDKDFVSDADLWRALKNADREAYEKIYLLYYKDLYEYANRFSKDKQLINDCLQDLFVNLWEKKNKITDTNDRILFYLMKALRNRLFRAADNIKRYIHEENLHENYSFELVLPQENFIIAEQEERAQHNLLQQSLVHLSDRQREAVYLRFYKNLSYAEIASIMLVEQQSAQNLIFRALQVLRKKLPSPMIYILLSLAVSS